ncbi:MAG: IS1595 family transposase [Chitinophagaceae bacterium]|nr:MAG: IS1595 family transposase [Chitinophagaceae bacterium]
MEVRYKSLSIFEFQQRFPDERSCYIHLSKLKWSQGYQCKKCGHKNYCKGKKEFDRQCTSCKYSESPTAGTLFHKLKFSVLKAFWIIYYLSTNKKGMASTELSRKLELRQKTCWLFKQKVMQAMKSSGQHPLEDQVEVDEFVVGQQEEKVRGRKNKKKKLVVLAIEKKGKGVGRMYAKHISRASKKELGSFMHQTIEKQAGITTDGWPAYKGLKVDFPNLKQVKSGAKGKNFNMLHRTVMGFKLWLRGIHAHAELLQGYLDEYCYRFNRSFMKEGIFDNLLNRMVSGQPCTYKMIIS